MTEQASGQRVLSASRYLSGNEARQHILLAVRDIIYQHGAELAVPASRVYLPDATAIGAAVKAGSGRLSIPTNRVMQKAMADIQGGAAGSGQPFDDMTTLMAEADCLFDMSGVERALDAMAGRISADLGDRLPVFYCVMNGGLITTGHLLTRLGFPLEVDYLHATRYRSELRGGELFWRVSPEVPMNDRHVVIVDDILDEGTTLAAILDYCRRAGAASISSAVLVEKQHERKAVPTLKADYCGLQVEDRYVFGFGMDYKGYWRNAPGIFAPRGL